MGLNSQLQHIRKEGLSMNDYLAKIKDIFDKHVAIGEPLNYRDKLMFIFNGIGEEYDSFVTSTLNRADKPSLDEIYSMLFTFEYKMEQRTSTKVSISLKLMFLPTPITKEIPNHNQFTETTPILARNKTDPIQANTHLTIQTLLLVFLANHRHNPFILISSGHQNHPQPVPNLNAKSVAKIGHIALNYYHRTNLNYQPQYTQPRNPGPYSNQAPNSTAAMLTTSTTPNSTHNPHDSA